MLRHDRRRQTRHLRGSEKLERARTNSVHRHAAVQWRRASSQSRREQSRARGEERAQRAVCAGQRQLPCNPGDHSTGQRRQGRAVHTGKHYRMRQGYTSASGACVVRRGRRRAEGRRRLWFDRSRAGGALLLFAPFWLCRRGVDVMTSGGVQPWCARKGTAESRQRRP